MLWWIPFIWAAGVAVLSLLVYKRAPVLDLSKEHDRKEMWRTVIFILGWPIMLLVMINISLKAHLLGNYERSWFDGWFSNRSEEEEEEEEK